MPYTPHPHHRNAAYAHQKSQWCIGIAEEQATYTLATLCEWTYGNCFWGLHILQAGPSQLGTSPLPESACLHIAKFVGDDQGNWHGYPVAHWLSPFDKPSTAVLESWFAAGFIGRAKVGKIKRGKRCVL